jgi:hypothetical protein
MRATHRGAVLVDLTLLAHQKCVRSSHEVARVVSLCWLINTLFCLSNSSMRAAHRGAVLVDLTLLAHQKCVHSSHGVACVVPLCWLINTLLCLSNLLCAPPTVGPYYLV